MKKNLTVLLAMTISLLIIVSCKKSDENEPNPDPITCLLVKITDSDGYFLNYVYSEDGKLMSGNDGTASGNELYWHYYYDNQNRISYEIQGSSDTTYYFYNTQNMITMSIEPVGSSGPDTVRFEYNQSNQLIKESRKYDGVNLTEYLYEWGTDENVKKVDCFLNNQLQYTRTFEYDTKVNRSTTEKGPILFPINKNNVKFIYENGTIVSSYSYTYDSNNLPLEYTLIGDNYTLIVTNKYDCN